METQNEDSTRSSSPPVPLDVIIEILLRLPAKSVGRFRCVSKLWSYSTTTPSFMKSFTIHSSARASILSVKMETGKRGFFSLPHQQDPIHPCTHVENHEMMLPKRYVYPSHYDSFFNAFIFDIQDSVRGLVCFENSDDIIICNPTLRQRITLPPPRISKPFASLLGYDPIADEHKVLCMSLWNKRDDPLILTLGFKQPWRKTKSSPIHRLMKGWRCINGVLYYYGVDLSIVSFDVRSEKFLIINKPDWHMFDVPLPHPKHSLISYKGRLAWIFDGLDLSSVLWILEDAEKQEWSSPIVFDVPFHRMHPNYICGLLRLSGDTGDDELIYTPADEPIFYDFTPPASRVESLYDFNTAASRAEPLYAFYYDLKTKITRTVSYEGNKVSSWSDFVCFPNHIESLKPLNQLFYIDVWNEKNNYYLS